VEIRQEVSMKIPKSAVINYNPDVCTACGICELMCSMSHENSTGPAASRTNILRDAFTARHSQLSCQQCPYPGCYLACPRKDKALCIDPATGVRYVNAEECNGCGLCIEACPFDPPRIKLNAEKKVAFKCDLCRDKEEGPLCVEFCPFQALTLVTKDKR
jgi:Fe-S-cluster-containing hydrogenase component 2